MTSDQDPAGTPSAGTPGAKDANRPERPAAPDGPGRAAGPDRPTGTSGQRGKRPERRRGPSSDPDSNAGLAWNAVGTLAAGAAFWGFVGWGIDRLTHLHTVFLPIGVIVGMAAAIYLVIYQARNR